MLDNPYNNLSYTNRNAERNSESVLNLNSLTMPIM